MENNIIPIALFAYARPDHLLQTLDGLRRNNVPLIYAFCDGPKDESKYENVTKVRDILKAVDWTEIIITERDSNWGLGTSIRAGVTEVFEKHDKVIVIEDDIVMRPRAYEYTCSALNFFENNNEVMTISMWTHPLITPKKVINGFFSSRFVCWGWGTYKKYWKLYDRSPLEIYNEVIIKNPKLLNWGDDMRIQALNSSRYNLWYIGYALLHFHYNKLSFFPAENLIINIGRDNEATNTKGGIHDDYKLMHKEIMIKSDFDKIIKPKSLPRHFRKYFDYKGQSFIYIQIKKVKRNYAKIIRQLFIK